METLDYSNGATNTYVVEARHQLIPTCIVCREFKPIMLNGSDYYRYFVQSLGYVQDIFPYLAPEQREVLITGTHPECWLKMMEDDENE